MNHSSDRYFVLVDGPEVETRIKGSRFLGQALAAATESRAQERLQTIRKRYHDATHHCSAWIVGPPDARIERFDDDGEPSGTAGPPLLHPLRGSELCDGMIVVTRWYGGTKLGAGGLVRAYGDCAAQALEAADRRSVWVTEWLEVIVDYTDVGTVEAVLARQATSLRQVERGFGDAPRFVLEVLASGVSTLTSSLIESTGARAKITRVAP